MGKREEYVTQLKLLIDKGSYEQLEDMLIANSNLPGPRGDLELASAFGDCFETDQVDDNVLNLLRKWAGIPVSETPSDSPNEFLPFCAIQAMAALYNLKMTPISRK